MNTINRNQRSELLTNYQPSDQYFNLELAAELGVSLDKRVNFGDNQLDINSPYYDFRNWLESSGQPPEITLRQAVESYGEAIQDEHERIDGIVYKTNPILLSRLELLGSEGHIPTVLAERMATATTNNFKYGIIDNYAGQKKFGKKYVINGYYETENDTLFIKPFRPKSSVRRIYIHEKLHALSGLSAKSEDDILSVSRIGLAAYRNSTSENSGKDLAHRVLNEGITEYVTNLIVYGQPGDIERERRKGKDSGGYVKERAIIQILADRIGIDTILNAWAEDYDPSRANTTDNLRKFIKAVRQNYGPGFLRKLDKIDREEGVDRALDFMRAADYLASKKLKSGGLLGRVAAKKQKAA